MAFSGLENMWDAKTRECVVCGMRFDFHNDDEVDLCSRTYLARISVG